MSSTPQSIKFNRFLKLILLEHKPLLACFGFVTRQKWFVSKQINLRKRLKLIDFRVKSGRGKLSSRSGFDAALDTEKVLGCVEGRDWIRFHTALDTQYLHRHESDKSDNNVIGP